MTLYFSEDWDPSAVYPAEEFGPRWHGWVTPVVTKDTLTAMANHWKETNASEDDANLDGALALVRFDGEVAVWQFAGDEEEYRMPARSDGLYDLGTLGFTFYAREEAGTDEAVSV